MLTSLNMTHQVNPWLDKLVAQTSKILAPFPDSHQSKVLGEWTFFDTAWISTETCYNFIFQSFSE